MGKGAETAKAQLDRANQLQQTQLDQQKAIRDQIMASIQKYLSGDVGFSPEQLATIQSQFLNENSAKFNSATSSILSSLRSRGVAGGDMPAGGDTARALSSLEGAKATSASQGILGTRLADLEQALTNKFNAASEATGQAAQLGSNVQSFGSEASASLGDYIKAKNAPGFLSTFAQGLGSGISAIATGGISSALGGLSKFLARKPATAASGGSWG